MPAAPRAMGTGKALNRVAGMPRVPIAIKVERVRVLGHDLLHSGRSHQFPRAAASETRSRDSRPLFDAPRRSAVISGVDADDRGVRRAARGHIRRRARP